MGLGFTTTLAIVAALGLEAAQSAPTQSAPTQSAPGRTLLGDSPVASGANRDAATGAAVAAEPTTVNRASGDGVVSPTIRLTARPVVRLMADAERPILPGRRRAADPHPACRHAGTGAGGAGARSEGGDQWQPVTPDRRRSTTSRSVPRGCAPHGCTTRG